MTKSGIESRKRVLAKFFVRHFNAILPICMIVGVLTVLSLLFVCSFSMAHDSAYVLLCGCVTDRFENISSFMEVMIAVYAVSAMNSFCEKVNEIQDIGEHLLESVFRKWLTTFTKYGITEEMIRDVYDASLKKSRGFSCICEHVSRLLLLTLGFLVAIILIYFLAFGIGNAVKPYILLSAAPILMYIISVTIYHVALHICAAVECRLSIRPKSEDDMKRQLDEDLATIMGAV